jgi:arylsulfatase
MRRRKLAYGLSLLIASFVAGTMAVTPVSAQQQPNIIMIMGDDIGIWNTGAYHRGLMAGRTPNLDQLAAEGMMFTLRLTQPLPKP